MDDHNYNPVEQDANARSIKYFYERNGSDFNWDFKENPIGYPGNTWTMADYESDAFQDLLNSLIINATIPDFTLPVIQGIFNTDFYNTHYIDYQ